ncbi:YjbF family lipoprotein [Vibrio panuliri]|uniref:YjbF family lipoprotein n=1 Tax=Vibrio panuliri TaxID=1381081 RepID=A0ABX3F9I0_9VIBR|nr:YjbF family lipoprotein [Vibrio panuliri]KAB1457275.1 YjbF family lipoprotein [Vibrio panuliri]OLQ85961.1 hypothetical protein BIY20_15675 [Vibrio panuliri]
MLFYTKCALLLLSVMTMGGCSQKFSDINATLNEALFGLPDVPISKQSVQSIPYASIKVNLNDGPSIVMVLAFADTDPDSGQVMLKWMSEDGAMLVTQNGRIIKTLNLYGANLLHIELPSTIYEGKSHELSYDAFYDWQPGYSYSQKASVTSKALEKATITSYIWNKETTLIEETVEFIDLGIKHQNQYYYDANNTVVKSNQWLVPNKLNIKYELLKPYHE